MDEYQRNYRLTIERIFNNWQSLRLAVEHGMGGSKSHQTAIDIMNYVCDYCLYNENITQGELEEVVIDLMDQEFNAICEDNSIPEICRNLLRYKQMCRSGQYGEVLNELNKQLPSHEMWLKSNFQITYKPMNADDSSSDTDTDPDSHTDDMSMDVDDNEANSNKVSATSSHEIESEPGWTTVCNRRRK